MKYLIPAALFALAAFLAGAISHPVMAESRVEVTPAPDRQTPVLCVLPETGRFVQTEAGTAFVLDDCDPREAPHLWRPRSQEAAKKESAI